MIFLSRLNVRAPQQEINVVAIAHVMQWQGCNRVTVEHARVKVHVLSPFLAQVNTNDHDHWNNSSKDDQ